MAPVTHHRAALQQLSGASGFLGLAACLMVGGCAQLKIPGGPDPLALGSAKLEAKKDAKEEPQQPQGELQKATEYWSKQYAANPRDQKTALNFARDLRAMGERQRALAVLQQASIFHGDSRELAGEYGRLALDLDQISLAGKLLAAADDPVNPDWRLISARGTVLAKQGKYAEAISFYDRALTLAPDQPSILNNLALATAMSGNPAKAELLLRHAEANDGTSPRIRQNLALVLGLQGKYDEAKLIAARDIPMDSAAENASLLRKVVKLKPQAVPSAGDTSIEGATAPLPKSEPPAQWAPAHVAEVAKAEPAAKPEAPAIVPATSESMPVAEAPLAVKPAQPETPKVAEAASADRPSPADFKAPEAPRALTPTAAAIQPTPIWTAEWAPN